MNKSLFVAFKKIVVENLISTSGTLHLKAMLIGREIREKSTGSISGHDYTEALNKYFLSYNQAIDKELEMFTVLLLEFGRYPTPKQFDELRMLYINHFKGSLLSFQKEYEKIKVQDSCTIYTFFRGNEANTSKKINDFFFKEKHIVKSKNSIDTIKFCTIISVILAACTPLLEKLWNSLFVLWDWVLMWFNINFVK